VQGRPLGGARRRSAGESAARGKGQAAVDAAVGEEGGLSPLRLSLSADGRSIVTARVARPSTRPVGYRENIFRLRGCAKGDTALRADLVKLLGRGKT
jgi:hypothetical protein